MWNLIRCQGGDLSLHVFSRVLAINSSARKNTKPKVEPWWRRGSEEPGRAQSGRKSVPAGISQIYRGVRNIKRCRTAYCKRLCLCGSADKLCISQWTTHL